MRLRSRIQPRLARRCRGLGFVASLLLAAVVEASPANRAALEPLPYPVLETRDPADRRKLGELRERLDQLWSEPEVGAGQLAGSFGELGRAYLAFEYFDLARACFLNASMLEPDEFGWHYYLGFLGQRDGQLEQAKKHLERALQLEPGDLVTTVRLGQIELESGQIESAQERFEAALRRDPENPAALVGLGRIAMLGKQWQLAIARFERVLKSQPEANAVQHQLGMAYRNLGNLERARAHLSQAGQVAVALADPRIDMLSELVTSSRAYLLEADKAKLAGQMEEALQLYRKAVEADGDSSLAQYALGTLLAELGQVPAALEHLRRAAELDPNYAMAHFNLAAALVLSGERGAAIEHYRRVIELDPENQDARVRCALLLADQGQTEEAIDLLERGLVRKPGHVDTLEKLALLLMRAGRWLEARDRLESALEQEPKPERKARLQASLAHVFGQQGSPELAVEAYQSVLTLDPTFAAAHFNFAITLALLGRHEEAAQAYLEAIRLEPTNVRAVIGLAQSLVALGRDLEARDHLDRGYQSYPNQLELADALARLLATSSVDAARDGARALAIARAAFERGQQPQYAETVALALAELGRFDQAIAWQERLIAVADQGGAVPAMLDRLRATLEQFRRRQPVRLPPATF